MKIMGVEQTVDLTEEKKMAVKQMIEVKNANYFYPSPMRFFHKMH